MYKHKQCQHVLYKRTINTRSKAGAGAPCTGLVTPCDLMRQFTNATNFID